MGHSGDGPDLLWLVYVLRGILRPRDRYIRTIRSPAVRRGRVRDRDSPVPIGYGVISMPQVFPRWANAVSRVTILGVLTGPPLMLWFCMMYVRSSYGTDAGVVREQPIPFSHEHHTGVLAIDCRYCHQSVETSSYAGMPATKTCMNCHSQIWVGSEMLAAVRASYAQDRPLHWDRVYNLPGFAYFDHSIHVHKGVGCSSCHGEVNRMPLMYQVPSLLMEWCLDCHRTAEKHLRPRELVFDMQYKQPPDQLALGRQLCEKYEIKSAHEMTSCSVCHR